MNLQLKASIWAEKQSQKWFGIFTEYALYDLLRTAYLAGWRACARRKQKK